MLNLELKIIPTSILPFFVDPKGGSTKMYLHFYYPKTIPTGVFILNSLKFLLTKTTAAIFKNEDKKNPFIHMSS